MTYDRRVIGAGMKTHNAIICAGIFLLCWLVLGFRGLDAGIIGPGCFLAGLKAQEKEQEVKAYIDRLQARVVGWFK